MPVKTRARARRTIAEPFILSLFRKCEAPRARENHTGVFNLGWKPSGKLFMHICATVDENRIDRNGIRIRLPHSGNGPTDPGKRDEARSIPGMLHRACSLLHLCISVAYFQNSCLCSPGTWSRSFPDSTRKTHSECTQIIQQTPLAWFASGVCLQPRINVAAGM